jgi:hypothetical protein
MKDRTNKSLHYDCLGLYEKDREMYKAVWLLQKLGFEKT